MLDKYKDRIASLLVATVLFGAVATMPALADDPFFCDNGTLEDTLSNLTEIIVYIAALVAVLGGTIYTVADAARPGGDGDYAENRKKSIVLGGGALIVLYGLDAIMGQLNENLSYECILPFSGD